MGDTLTMLVSGLLGGSLIAGIASLVTARSVARKNRIETKLLEQKAPAEVDSIAVLASDQAVLSMERSMKAAEVRAEKAEKRITLLEEEREEDRRTIGELQDQVRDLQGKVQHAEEATAQAREASQVLERRLNAMAQQHQTRGNGGV